MSPSLHSLDHVTGLLLFDHLFRSAAAALVSLIQPLRLPHSPFLSQPQVHVSIIALDSTELTNEEPSENPRSPKLHVLLPSVVVSSSNVPQVLQDLRNSLLHLENLQVGHTHMKSVSKSSSEYSDRAGDIKLLLQSGLFTLSLMNLSAHPQLILVTPGDLQLTSSESGVLDSVLSQCARSDVRVTILHTMSPNGRVNTSSSSIIKLDGFDETLSTLIARQNATLGESQIRSFGDVADTGIFFFFEFAEFLDWIQSFLVLHCRSASICCDQYQWCFVGSHGHHRRLFWIDAVPWHSIAVELNISFISFYGTISKDSF
jgi:hypothetical protein